MGGSGYVKVFRDFRSRDWYRDAAAKAVYLELLLTAAYEPSGILKPGQAWCSVRGLAERLGLSERQVRTSIKHLVDDEEITTKATKSGTIATLTNWQLQQGAKQAVRTTKPAKAVYRFNHTENPAREPFMASPEANDNVRQLIEEEARKEAERKERIAEKLATMTNRS